MNGHADALVTHNVRDFVKAAAARLAKEDGVSLNQWISVAIAQKIGVVETASDFLRRRTGKARLEHMLPFLDKAKREAPSAGDEA